MARSHRPLFRVDTEHPHHHEVRLFPNYPLKPEVDPDHLVLGIRQRTTLGGLTIRLPGASWARTWRWLAADPRPESPYQGGTLTTARWTGQRVETLTLADVGPDVLLSITHRADDYPVDRAALLCRDSADLLAAALYRWLYPDQPTSEALVTRTATG